MKILVINCGSSSVKYKLFEGDSELLSGHVDGIGLPTCVVSVKTAKEHPSSKERVDDHVDAVLLALKSLIAAGVIKDYSEIRAIGHRVVHGAEFFSESMLVSDRVIRVIKHLCELAPLHNPHNLAGILACKKILPKVPQVAVFDTAFHTTIEQNQYALPHDISSKFKIKRYGFHGISHKYVSALAAGIVGHKSRIITCHLGNGSSITAVKDGKSVMTSMGFTPLEGLMMGTRSGTIDPSIPFFLMRKGYSASEVEQLLNKKSGLLGLTGTSDLREVRKKAAKGDKRAKQSMDFLASQIAFYISGFASYIGGVDAIVFTAGIGEGGWFIRRRVLRKLSHLGVEMDGKANRRGDQVISTHTSKVKVLVLRTNEELEIARDTRRIVR